MEDANSSAYFMQLNLIKKDKKIYDRFAIHYF